MACNTVFARKTVLASLLAIGVAGSAYAQGTGNVIGGGSATLTGGASDMTITYSRSGAGGGASYKQLGRIVTFGNSDGKPSWTYGAPAASAPGSEAWMIGGGEDRQVVYVSPYQRR